MARRNEAEIVLTAKNRTKSAFSAVNKGLGRLASIGLAGAAAGTALLTRAALQQIDALAKQSQLLGITTEKLAAFQLVAAKTGVEQKTLEKSLINVTRVVAEAAEGTGLATDTLKKLGLEAKALSQQSPDEQFLMIADAMKGLNTQSEKVLAAYELFGGRGAALLRTLEAGSAAFEEAEERTKRFGTAISAVDAKGVEDANDAFTDLQESLKGVGFDLARRFAPGMEAASNSVAGFLVTIRRDFIPAMALMLEQMNLVQNNVRGLSDIELLVRIEVQADKISDLEARAAELQKSANRVVANAVKVGEDEFAQIRADAVQASREQAVADELEAAEARLEAVRSELDRRRKIELDAEREIEEAKEAQKEEARIIAAEKERDARFQKYALEIEDDKEHVKKLIAQQREVALENAAAARQRIVNTRQALIAQGKLEERAAVQTIRLRQATAATSVQILQSLAGKNKTVARALFLVEKGLAIARTIQNTAAASVKALAELGPIAGPPAAAAIQAYGAAQVGLIAATALTGVGSIGGGGGLGSIGGASGGAGGGFDDTGGGGFPGGEVGGGTGLSDQGVVQLIFPSVFGITPDVIDALADALREASENRDIIVVSGTGRNAELLNGANG